MISEVLSGVNEALGVVRMVIYIYVCMYMSRGVVECRQAKVAGCMS